MWTLIAPFLAQLGVVILNLVLDKVKMDIETRKTFLAFVEQLDSKRLLLSKRTRDSYRRQLERLEAQHKPPAAEISKDGR